MSERQRSQRPGSVLTGAGDTERCASEERKVGRPSERIEDVLLHSRRLCGSGASGLHPVRGVRWDLDPPVEALRMGSPPRRSMGRGYRVCGLGVPTHSARELAA